MLSEYYYLVSSLPLLALGETPGLSDEALLSACADQLSPACFAELKALDLVPEGNPCCEADRRWQAWETYRRNRTCRARAIEQQADSDGGGVRPEADAFPADGKEIDEILAAPDPAARERAMDELRWRRLADFGVGHDFDFDALVLYRLRQLLALKWDRWDRRKGLDALVSLVNGAVEQARGATGSPPTAHEQQA